MKRLYFFTGKGGVGKSTFSLAFAYYLLKKGQQVTYFCLDQDFDQQVCRDLGIPFFDLRPIPSAELYLEKKLGSRMIAKGIVKTPFFESLLNITPALGHLISLGHIVDLLHDGPEMIAVADSPPSGHTLTMFQSTGNFQNIFKTGILVKDIIKIQRFLKNAENLLIHIISLPTELAMQEALDLKKELEELDLPPIKTSLNGPLGPQLKDHMDSIPEFLAKKINLENEVIENYSSEIDLVFPHINSTDPKEVIKGLSLHMEGML